MKSAGTKTRWIPRSLAPILEELELRRPTVITRALLCDILSETAVGYDPAVVAERLVRSGWLLPLKRPDAWEFVPASRAGRYPSGDPWIDLRALLAHDPGAPVAVAFESAVWELGHSAHQPARPVLAHRRGWRAPASLDARVVTFEWNLPTATIRGLPVWTEATAVVGAAHRPAAQGNWANADDWLPEIFRVVAAADVLAEARDRPVTTRARLGYLAEWSGRVDIANAIEAALPAQLPVTFLGPREQRERWSSRWRVYDAVLPRR